MLKVCSKANRKITILNRMLKFLKFEKKRVLIKVYFESQFKYCPLLWKFHERQVNNKINRVHERALRIIYEDNTSSFHTLLENDVLFSVHNRNIQQLALEMYKITKGLSPTAISSLFLKCSNNRHTRSQSDLLVSQINEVYFGQNPIRYLKPLIWNLIPTSLRNVEFFVEFKFLIKNWRLCKDYIPQVGVVKVTQIVKSTVVTFTLCHTPF